MENKTKINMSPEVAEVFLSYPKNIIERLFFLRDLIFESAAKTEGVGEILETLKWGQPSYLTPQTKSGSTIRIDQIKSRTGVYAMYFHCQTTLIDSFRELYGDTFKYEGNRCILFSEHDEIPVKELSHCISMALTYHLKRDKQI